MATVNYQILFKSARVMLCELSGVGDCSLPTVNCQTWSTNSALSRNYFNAARNRLSRRIDTHCVQWSFDRSWLSWQPSIQ